MEDRFEPIEYIELLDIVNIWADAALGLEEKDIKMMKKLVKTQSSKSEKMLRLRTKQDRRISHKAINFPFLDHNGKSINSERRLGGDRRLCG